MPDNKTVIAKLKEGKGKRYLIKDGKNEYSFTLGNTVEIPYEIFLEYGNRLEEVKNKTETKKTKKEKIEEVNYD